MDLELTPTVGLVGGMTVQFAEGAWPGEIGPGLAMPDEAFDLVEPHLRSSCPGWTPDHRYGVFELSVASRITLLDALRAEAKRIGPTSAGTDATHEFFVRLSDWLAERLDPQHTVSVLGY